MSWVITPQEKVLAPETINSVVAWWDASHAPSFTFSSGTSVSAWASRIGSYVLTQSDSQKQPERNGSVNSLASVVFNGTSDALSVSSFDLTPGGQKLSLWCVFSAVANGDRVICEHSANQNSNPGGFLLLRTISNIVSLSRPAFTSAESPDTVTTTPKEVVAWNDASLVNSETSLRLNSVLGTRRDNNANTTSSNRNDTLFVGARGGTSIYLSGQICELGITSSVLSNDEVGRLESYLSLKWGLGF
jgi:hypothetical protein